MFGYISDSLFNDIRVRNQQVHLNNYPGVDEDILSLVRKYNALTDLQTVWSCSGHLDDPTSHMYLTMVITQKGFRHLEIISNVLNEHWFSHPEYDTPYLSLSRLVWFFDRDLSHKEIDKRVAKPNLKNTYPVWTIEYEGNVTDRKFNKACMDLIQLLESIKF